MREDLHEIAREPGLCLLFAFTMEGGVRPHHAELRACVARNLRLGLAARSWTPRMLADHAHLSAGQVFRILACEHGPRLATLDPLATALARPPWTLIAPARAARSPQPPQREYSSAAALRRNLRAWCRAEPKKTVLLLSRQTGVGSATLYRIISGSASPRIDTLADIALGLGVQPWQLLRRLPRFPARPR